MSIEKIEHEKCTGCAACYSCCPAGAIRIIKDEEGFSFPSVNSKKCIECDLCRKICPVLNYTAPEHNNNPEVFALINNDLTIRQKSSSGGVFYELAKDIILSDGIVYGTKMNDDLIPIITSAQNMEQLIPLMGSKYVQAEVGDAFKLIKRDLEAFKKVLFVGTPCQVAGLKMFLDKDYDNLILVDLVCHGVPSRSVFNSYINDLCKKYKENVISVTFRDKKYGWNRFAMRLQFANEKCYCKPNQIDPWMLAFNANIMLRNSCYHCVFKTRERISDLTLGDLWGVDNVAHDMNDNNGISLVIVQSEKGKRIMERLSKSFTMREIDFDRVQNENSFHQIMKPAYRNEFISTAVMDSFNVAYRRYVKKPAKQILYINTRLALSNMKRKIKRLIK